MARQARWNAPGTLHHVMVLGIERRRMVDDEQDRKESPAPYCWPRALSDYKNGASALTPPATSCTRHGETLTAHSFSPRQLRLHSYQHERAGEGEGRPGLARTAASHISGLADDVAVTTTPTGLNVRGGLRAGTSPLRRSRRQAEYRLTPKTFQVLTHNW